MFNKEIKRILLSLKNSFILNNQILISFFIKFLKHNKSIIVSFIPNSKIKELF